ncbi:hypothetical protein Nepgr_012082 [Nepenthes gracilis]|uniref:Uncharacterized protein n=1 Tax=Nepenthes gracilis TaxID=150966 RepID=A0AAD3SGW2_NEPGR|nr:hypothetical protein Nepgr_012082 [Nepenthes gracilis]
MANVAFKRLACLLQNRFLKTTATNLWPKATAKKTSSAAKLAASVIQQPPSSSFTVQFFMNSCGLPLRAAISTSKKIRLNENKKGQMESVIAFLKSHGFSDVQIAKLILEYPQFLHFKISQNLAPKIEYLIECGFTGSLLPEIVLLCPYMLRRSLAVRLKPTFEFLRKYVGTNERALVAIKRSPLLLQFNIEKNMQSNVEYLIKEGMPSCSISRLIITQPTCLLQNIDKVAHKVETVKKFGIHPSTRGFVDAFRVMVSMSELTWKKKVEVLKSLGWSEEDVIDTFVRSPLSLARSEEKLRSVMDFYVNTVKIEPKSIIAQPMLLGFSLNRRLIPRFNVLKILEEKNLLNNKKPASILAKSEKDFVNTYIFKNLKELPILLEIYPGCKGTENKALHLQKV